MIAKRFYGKRSALIGDAAVGMHPVTAHGFNLGLSSADILAKLILEAEQRGQDIGAASLLEKYSSKHMLHAHPLYHDANMMLKLFTNETALKQNCCAVWYYEPSNNFPPLKKLITKQLTG